MTTARLPLPGVHSRTSYPAESYPADGKSSAADGTAAGDWDFAGLDTQYSTHGLHTYVAAMIPALARRLVDAYAPAGATVLDPFCGGGAVLVESIRSGRAALGNDINALAALVAGAKTTYIPAEQIRTAGSRTLEEAAAYEGPPLRFDKADFVEYWFKDYMLAPLTALRFAIDRIGDADLRNLFQALFSATVRSVSLTHRNEVRLRRMTPERQAAFNPDVFEVFRKYLDLAEQRIPALPAGAKATITRGDTRQMRFANDAADTIVCSPPYGDERNGVNYTQFSKNMLYWLGYTREQMRESKDSSLGWGKERRIVPPSRTLCDSLDRLADNSTSLREAIAFYSDYYAALREMARVARNRIIIVIGNRVLNRQVLDNGQITTELMNAVGIPLEVCHFRKLPTKRLPKMREAGAAIDREAILVFRK